VINHSGVLCLLNICFLLILNYSCANSYLFNRIHWSLVSHNIALLYLLSNKDFIRAIYINFFLFMQLFLFLVASVVSIFAFSRCNIVTFVRSKYNSLKQTFLYYQNVIYYPQYKICDLAENVDLFINIRFRSYFSFLLVRLIGLPQ
jgi:hypothetical protein